MPLKRYVLTAYAIFVLTILCVGLASKPSRAAAEYGSLLFLAVVVAALNMVVVGALASRTPLERRTSFRSYRWANIYIALPVFAAVMLVIIAAGEALGIG